MRRGDAPRVGLMGGTFDPIHLAHLVTAEAALEQLGLERVIFIPAGLPPHKLDREITPAELRYEMVKLAVASNDRFEVSRIELERAGPSYSVDTVEAMRRLMPGAKLYFITGTDAILGLDTWQDPQRLLRLCQFVAARRPGFDEPGIGEAFGAIEERYGCRILRIEAPGIDVSSSDLRRRVRQGRSLKYLVPDAVADYIQKHGLYR